ncbi:hypothetical protein ACC692_37845, partial [Rhizobium ruizarguesonis]
WFPEENVRVVSGEYSVWYPQGETTPDVMKAFCRICGGGGFSKSGTYFPGEPHIVRKRTAGCTLTTRAGAEVVVHRIAIDLQGQ